MSADLYLRLPEPRERWEGAEVKGPYCATSRTLPTTARFEPLAGGAGLWRARVVDPTCWSLDHPMLYRVRIAAREARGESTIVEIECGIRRFGCKEGSFWWDSKRWVLRGARLDHVQETDLVAWKNARMAMCIPRPDAAFLDAAARQGTMLVVDLGGGAASHELIAVTRCPAVMLVIVDHAVEIDELRALLPNVVIAKRFDPGRMEQPPQDADAVLLDALAELPLNLTMFGTRPVVAFRDLTEAVDQVAVARAACDQLQRDLAGRYDLNGYVV